MKTLPITTIPFLEAPNRIKFLELEFKPSFSMEGIPLAQQIPTEKDFDLMCDYSGSDRILLDFKIIILILTKSSKSNLFCLCHEASVLENVNSFVIPSEFQNFEFKNFEEVVEKIKNLIQINNERIRQILSYGERLLS